MRNAARTGRAMQVVTSCWLVIGGRNTGTPPDIVDRGKRSSARAVTMAEASALDAAHRAQADSKGEAADSIARLQRAIPARGSNHGRDPSTWSRINGRGFSSGSTFAGSGGDGVDLARPCAGAPGRMGCFNGSPPDRSGRDKKCRFRNPPQRKPAEAERPG
jgi:hypothetical protein